MSASLASPTHFWKRPFWRVLEFDKFAVEWPLLRKRSLLQKSQRQKSKRTSKICKSSLHQKSLFSFSLLRHHYIKSPFLVDHYYDTFNVLILPMASKKFTTSKIKNIFLSNYLWQCFSTWVLRNPKVPPKYFWVPPNIWTFLFLFINWLLFTGQIKKKMKMKKVT